MRTYRPTFSPVSRLAALTLILSLTVPTWGSTLGHTGNWIPFTVASVPLFLAFIFALKHGFGSSALATSIPLLFFLFLPALAIFSTLLSPYAAESRDYVDLLRFFTMGAAFTVGAYLKKHSAIQALSLLFAAIVIGMLLNLLLFVNFWVDPWNSLAQLYSTRQMGGTKFPGAWNYPYNLTVFLALYLAATWVAFSVLRRASHRLFIVLGGVASLSMLISAQSRSGVLALGVALVITPLTLMLCDALRDFGGSFARKLAVSIIVSILVPFALWYLASQSDFAWTGYYANLKGISITDDPRIGQIQLLFQELREHPQALFIGFGVSREFPVWIESSLLYLQRYGLLGFVSIVLLPLVIIIRGVVETARPGSPGRVVNVHQGLLFFAVFLAVNSLTNNIFFHFRFMALYLFIVGFVSGTQRMPSRFTFSPTEFSTRIPPNP